MFKFLNRIVTLFHCLLAEIGPMINFEETISELCPHTEEGAMALIQRLENDPRVQIVRKERVVPRTLRIEAILTDNRGFTANVEVWVRITAPNKDGASEVRVSGHATVPLGLWRNPDRAVQKAIDYLRKVTPFRTEAVLA